MFTAAASSSAGRWRTAFLSLRDEILSTPPPLIPLLLQDLLFSHSHSLLSVVSLLPPHELTSDCLFLLDLVSKADGPDWIAVSLHTCQLIHDVFARVLVQQNSSSWPLLLHSFASVLEFLLRQPMPSPYSSAYFSRIEPVNQCFETLRRFAALYHRNSSHQENIHLVNFLLRIIPLLHQDLVASYGFSNHDPTLDLGKKLPEQSGSLWDAMALAFDMFGGAFSVSESFFPSDVSQSSLEVLRKVMDVLASKGQLVEDRSMWSFYSCLLDCVHLVLTNVKCPVSDHVSSFIAALRMFFCFGLTGTPHFSHSDVVHKDKQLDVKLSTLKSGVSKNAKNTPYRPPHLRKRDELNSKLPVSCDWRRLSAHDSASSDVLSSDSDFSDSDGSIRDSYCSQSSKVRRAALVCIQDLCQADSKSFTTQWMALFPTSDVLKPRKFEATLMTCLLFDPHLKVRIASASALATMMDGPSSIFLQVAEYKESTKYGSFMPLSNSLGLILMQLHTGILHLIHRDNHGRLLIQLFKILLLLISSTPYSRMPGELLPKVIMSLHGRINEGFPFKNDKTGLLVLAIGCLTAAFSTFPPQMKVHNMLLDETSAGFEGCEWKSGVLCTLFRFAEQFSDSSTCVEALQALRAMALNYPTVVSAYWERISVLVYKLLQCAVVEYPATTWKASVREPVGYIGDKVLTAAIKVLDGCLRAISGFKGTEDLQYDRLMDTPFTSDCLRSIRISSAPSYGFENPEFVQEPIFQAGCYQWSEAIRKHIVLVLQHGSAVVRSTAVTCFSGITSSIFVSFNKQEKDFITSSIITAALHDKTPSVRSAACRAIGVISCFPETSLSVGIYENFILAVEANTRDPLISVRITASWALANVCEALRYRVDGRSFEVGSNTTSLVVDALIECALRLTEDADKVKANAVRALGSISKYVKLRCMTSNHEVLPLPHHHSSNSHHLSCAVDSSWLERAVQAFISSVTTGNVKVYLNK
ncbi:uncharacterized protein LOC18029060 isoform X2 [Eutrema salsugineum]|uniref:uncharacterized protein LOC18029060 isoform X2 n=1 Tax=Eutrema salsugineum TaxID=72664 RepID=UPI000CED0161|nr:uncharacterized protein LOC18029060 isoform X2 [Eutrema salsugineum]